MAETLSSHQLDASALQLDMEGMAPIDENYAALDVSEGYEDYGFIQEAKAALPPVDEESPFYARVFARVGSLALLGGEKPEITREENPVLVVTRPGALATKVALYGDGDSREYGDLLRIVGHAERRRGYPLDFGYGVRPQL